MILGNTHEYWLTRWLFQRSLALIYLVAFDPRPRKDFFAYRGTEVRRRRVLERTAESPYARPEWRRDDYLAVTVTVTEAHPLLLPCTPCNRIPKDEARTTRPGPLSATYNVSLFRYLLALR